MAAEDDFWGDAGNWSGTAGADRFNAERTPATDSDATPAAWVTGQIARVLGGSNGAGRRAHGNPSDARWTQEIPVVDADSPAPVEDAAPTDPHVPTTDVPTIVDATPVADTFDDVWFNDDDGYGDPAGASPNPAEDDAWSSLGDWDVEPEPQRKLPVDPLFAKLGVLAVVVTLAVPVVLSLRSSGDGATLETAATGLTAPAADVTILPTTLSQIVAEPEATATPETAAAAEPEATTAATTAGTPAATIAETDAEFTTRRASPVATADDSDTDAGGIDASTTAAADACGADYDVVGGDYWIRLADGAGVDIDELLAVNDATLDTPLYPGAAICLPVGASTPPPPAVTTAASTTAAPTTAAPTTAASTTAAPTTAAPTTAPPTTAAPTTAVLSPPSVPNSPGPGASPDQVKQVIRNIWPDELEERAIEIAWRESNWIPTADNGHCCHGVFQIYWTVHRSWLADFGVTSLEQLYDPVTNTRVALEIYNRAGGWGPWGL
ncbi:MAG: hypothetical protein AAGF73_11860 [Actinomycetota bacterium]